MFYTQQRAKDLSNKNWRLGTEIGVASSKDFGRSWQYVGTVPGLSFEEKVGSMFMFQDARGLHQLVLCVGRYFPVTQCHFAR